MEYAPLNRAILAALVVAASTTFATAAQAQTKVWRCGNTYTNSEAEAKAKDCKLMSGGNITVVEGTRTNGSSGTKVASAPQTSTSGTRVDAGEQKARDNDARAILEAELKKAEARRDELAREYNKGEPEMLGPEHKNYQKYQDRLAELKASIARNEEDIAGLKRELARAGARP